APPPDPKPTDWTDLLRAIHATPGERVVVLNHPRDLHAGFRPFDPEHFNPIIGTHRRGPLKVDAIEVVNSGALQSDPWTPIRDWMAVLNHGERITAVGASDSHDVARFIVGQGRTYIACPDGDPAHIDVERACRALREGRALVSLGLLARMTVEDRFSVGDLATKLGEQVHVAVEVFGPSWTTADRVGLYADGIAIREAGLKPTPGPLKARITWTLPRPPHDVHLVAIATGPGVTAPYWPIARPYQPTSRAWTPRVLGLTNPIYLDADGDGAWTSPRAYAEAVVERAGTSPDTLLPALRTYDEAVAAQAAALCQAAGGDVRGDEFARHLRVAPEPIQRGFAAFASTRKQTSNSPPQRED
ncbi:MAG: CehA/McbA family metallohydrolase, partial [Isosphaeraceae bacterium]|nr:CehA/McbA family metallohydrolase [Isosphaeraceae bacterium]